MSEICEKYNHQNFEKLLLNLSKKVNGDGVSMSLQQKCDQAFQHLKVERETYFRTKIFYDHVVSSFLERKNNSINNESHPENDDPIWEMFTKSCVIDFFEGTTDGSILGLNKDAFHIGSDEKKFLFSIQSAMLSRVETRIQEQYDALLEVFGEIYNTQSDPASHLLAQEMELEQLKKQLTVHQSTKKQLFQEYFKSLSSSCGVLLELMKTYRVDKLISNNTVTINWLLSHCEALNFKIKMQEYQLLAEIYTKDSIKALNVIRNELLKQDAQTSVELARMSDLLTTYEAVGPEFKRIVHEYSRIRDEIENKKWALDEFEKHKK
ncbi:hypothetical protein HELRODRAFT_192765 [Helobdella robusta]|uniref:HAUS augmin-like complex subunit 4 n=1 Tax=Helobdella robusta TaxID=6412 RepID=T1FU98_HELRO|nr:hypothetical protein HELRODRAFT_192765 [Helobdella robusta]ESN99728.1 hypothetical protein HELRODRAFT_192765 [Helobdella robusta]